jgi:pectinesterase
MTTIPRITHILFLSVFAWIMATPSSAQVHSQQWKHTLRQTDEAFFKSDEARRIGEQLMLYQRVTGGWPKNINMVAPLTQEQRETSAMPIPTKC